MLILLIIVIAFASMDMAAVAVAVICCPEARRAVRERWSECFDFEES